MWNPFRKKLKFELIVNPDFAFAVDFTPVQHASKFIPSWFKQLRNSSTVTMPFNQAFNNEVAPDSTARSCIGIINTLTTGYIMPMWSDFQISIQGESYRYQFADGKSSLTLHSPNQSNGFYSQYHIFKIESPWLFKSSKPMKVVVMPATYVHNEPLPYIIMPGIGETMPSCNASATHFFIAIKKSEDLQTINIMAGTPLIHSIPITDKPYDLDVKVVSSDEYKRYDTNTRFKFVKQGIFSRKSQLKCPFKH